MGGFMQATRLPVSASKTGLWTGRSIHGLFVLFFIFDGMTKILQVPQVQQAQGQLGYPASQSIGIGILLLVFTAVFVIPPTSVLGALLITAYLGGAAASQIRIGGPAWFPIMVGVLLWAGLYLREARLRTLVPLRKSF